MKVRDIVEQGQLVAQIAQPELEDQITKAQAELEELTAQCVMRET